MARVPSLASSEKIWQCYIVASHGEKNCSFAVFCYSFSTVIWILITRLNCIPLQSFIFKILSFSFVHNLAFLSLTSWIIFCYMQAAASIKDGKRILFQFDRAAFSFKFLPFKVPYPVPFRLLGDEAKGWLDTTYLSPSGDLRISRGNKVNEHFISS